MCVVHADEYFRVWGVWPEADRAKRSIRIEDVVRVESSPYRLPAALANKLYAAGESGMGYTLFIVVPADGRRLPFTTGNAVDFPALPDGVRTDDVLDVPPHEGREYFQQRSTPPHMRSVEYDWCLYC